MNKTYLIFKHEFIGTIKRMSWIVMTLIVPVLAFLGLGIFVLVSSSSEPAEKSIHTIAYVDEVGIFTSQNHLGTTRLLAFDSKEEAHRALMSYEVSEYLIIPADYLSSGIVERYTMERELITPPGTVEVIKVFLSSNLLKEKVPPEMLSLIVSPVKLEVTRVSEAGDLTQEKSHIGNLLIPGVFSLLLGLALMFGATTLVSGLGEEKESRLIEVLFSSVSIRQLLVGKVLALGAAGLLQVLLWLISAPLLMYLASSGAVGFMSKIQIPGHFLLLGIVYFVLGYLLFAVLSIFVGAISSNAREGGQLSMFYTLMSFVPLWFSSLFIAFPNASIWVALTLFPVTAPVQTMLRLGGTGVPLWQILTSIGLLGLAIIGGLTFSIKVFRVNMLLHGKRPGFREIIQSMKQV